MVKNFMRKEPSVFDGNRNPSGSVSQISSFDRMFGNNENTVGDGNVFGGNFNQGNVDYSLNLSNQRGY